MSKGWKIVVSILAVLTIVLHCVAYSYDKLGVDQLVPCVLGYFSIWVILIALEGKDEEEIQPISKEKKRKWYHTSDIGAETFMDNMTDDYKKETSKFKQHERTQ